MATRTRLRSRSSVEHIFELVEHLDEGQLSDLLQDLNSTPDTNVQVSKGVEYFEEHRRMTLRPDSRNILRPTPSFLNQPHEPADWPRQKPRPVSGSQWRNSMRIVSAPYDASKNSPKYNGGLPRHQTEPISPPISPPLSPPLSPPTPKGLSSPARRSVTAPLPVRDNDEDGVGKLDVEVEAVELPLARELTPPRDRLSLILQHEDSEHPPRPSLSEFGSFSFGFDGAAEPEQGHVEPQEPVSPHSPVIKAPAPAPMAQLPPSPPTSQPEFSRMQTMPLPSFHASESLDVFSSQPLDMRPRTATGDASTASGFNKQRAFRRISRPVFLSPLNTPTPDDLAKKLSAYLFEDAPLSPPPPRRQTPPATKSVPASLEDMLKEPVTPRSRVVFGRVETEMPTSGIFQVLTEG